jgi:hypothetical protein
MQRVENLSRRPHIHRPTQQFSKPPIAFHEKAGLGQLDFDLSFLKSAASLYRPHLYKKRKGGPATTLKTEQTVRIPQVSGLGKRVYTSGVVSTAAGGTHVREKSS